MIYAQDKVIKHLDIKPKGLATIKLGLTDKCNYNCAYCSEDKSKGRVLKDPVELINRLQDKCKAIVLSGNGEPMMHPDFKRIMTDTSIEMGLITNGSLFNEDLIAIAKDRFKWIRVSLDASTEEEYGKRHGVHPKLFKTVLDNVLRLTSGNATVGVAFLIENKDMDFKACMQIGARCFADYVQFRNYHGDTGRYGKYLPAKALYKEVSSDDLPPHCHIGKITKVIEPSGDVYWCCMHRGNPVFKLGNVFEDIDVLDKTMKVDTSKCPKTCIHRKANEVLGNLLEDRYVKHENFI